MNIMKLIPLFRRLDIIALVLLLPGWVSAQESRPNIVLMLVDNLGYGDIGPYGGGDMRGAPTPNLDKLADEGLKLTNFNVEPECTPSRSALMTGRMPIRSGTDSVDVFGGKDGLAPWEYTIAELLSDTGYDTAMFGKWHLGSSPERHPNAQGFDEWYGIPRSSLDTAWELQPGYDPEITVVQPILEGVKGEQSQEVGPYNYAARGLIDHEITQRAVAYIKKHKPGDKPFFLYVPFTGPHGPPIPHPDFDKPGKSDYQNKLMELDAYAGWILDALDEQGLAKDTLVIWASENGPQTYMGIGHNYGGHGDPGPFRGEFPSAWEGAIRVPAIFRWPGRIEAGRTSNEIVSGLDFYATFATLAGAGERVPSDRAMDSIDQTAFLLGEQEKSDRESVLFFYGGDLLSMRFRQFKIHMLMRDPARGGSVVQPGQNSNNAVVTKPGYPWIFDVENDPKELWNQNTGNGWLAITIARLLKKYESSIKEYPNIKPGAEGPDTKQSQPGN